MDRTWVTGSGLAMATQMPDSNRPEVWCRLPAVTASEVP